MPTGRARVCASRIACRRYRQGKSFVSNGGARASLGAERGRVACFGGEPCDNLVTIEVAEGRAGLFRGYFAWLVSGVAPSRASDHPSKVAAGGMVEGRGERVWGTRRPSPPGGRGTRVGLPHLPMGYIKRG